MIPFVLFFVLAVIILDLQLLRRYDPQFFSKTFDMRRSHVILLLASLFIILLLSSDLLRMVALYFILVILPYYLYKRRSYQDVCTDSRRLFELTFDAHGVVLSWIFGGAIISAVISVYFDFVLQFDSQLGEIILSAMGTSLLLMVLVYRASLRISEKGFMQNVALTRAHAHWFMVSLGPMLAGFAFALVSAMLITSRKTEVVTPIGEVIANSQSLDIFWIFLFLAICVAPAVEEIVFRGYFFRVISKTKGLFWAVIIISLTFALLHVGQYWGDWLAILMITLIGFALTGLRVISGTTISSIVMHYTYNFFVVLLPVVMIIVNNPSYVRYQLHGDEMNFPEKEELLQEALKVNPNMAEVHYELALLYASAPKNKEKALRAINDALLIHPKDKVFLELKASILESVGRFDDALIIRNGLMTRSVSDQLKRF